MKEATPNESKSPFLVRASVLFVAVAAMAFVVMKAQSRGDTALAESDEREGASSVVVPEQSQASTAGSSAKPTTIVTPKSESTNASLENVPAGLPGTREEVAPQALLDQLRKFPLSSSKLIRIDLSPGIALPTQAESLREAAKVKKAAPPAVFLGGSKSARVFVDPEPKKKVERVNSRKPAASEAKQ